MSSAWAFVAVASSRTQHRSLPALSSALAVATTALAQAIAANHARVVRLDALAAVTLAVGFTIAALIGMSVHLEQATRDRAEALQRANVDLQGDGRGASLDSHDKYLT